MLNKGKIIPLLAIFYSSFCLYQQSFDVEITGNNYSYNFQVPLSSEIINTETNEYILGYLNSSFEDGTSTVKPIKGKQITGYIAKIEPNKDKYTLKYKIYPKEIHTTVEKINFEQKAYNKKKNISFKNSDKVCINYNLNSKFCIE